LLQFVGSGSSSAAFNACHGRWTIADIWSGALLAGLGNGIGQAKTQQIFRVSLTFMGWPSCRKAKENP
jgi:hypothetical protein